MILTGTTPEMQDVARRQIRPHVQQLPHHSHPHSHTLQHDKTLNFSEDTHFSWASRLGSAWEEDLLLPFSSVHVPSPPIHVSVSRFWAEVIMH